MLEVLLAAQGDVVTPDELVERAWDEQLDPLSNTVRMTIMTLRRKLGDPPLVADRPRERLPRVTPALRIRLTALYGGLFVVFVAILMGASYWLMGRPPRPHAAGGGGRRGARAARHAVPDRARGRDARRDRARLGARRARARVGGRGVRRAASASSPTPGTSCAAR